MDIFVKKYQPEIYDLWRLGLENSYEDLNENNKRSCVDIFQGSPLKRKSSYSIESYLNVIFNSYLKPPCKNISSAKLNHQLMFASQTKQKFLNNTNNLKLVKRLSDVPFETTHIKTLKELCSYTVNKLLTLYESDSKRNISTEALVKTESYFDDTNSPVSSISFSNKLELQNQACENGCLFNFLSLIFFK